MREKFEDTTLLALKLEEEATSRQPLETRRGKEIDSPLETPERVRPCQYLNFSPVKPISDS